MDPNLSQPNPIDSPSSSNVLRFWEGPVSDFGFSYPPKDPTSSSSHLYPPPFSSSGSSYGPCEPLDHLTDNRLLLDLDDKLVLEQEGYADCLGYFNDGLVVGDGHPGPLNSENEINDPSIYWMPEGQLNCVGCQVLREVSHSNGIDITKLEIHGTLGFIHHGIIEVVQCGVSNEVAVNIERQLIDMHSFEQVKQYLIDYGQMRAQEGFTVIQDSLCAFYDCLCAGMSGGDAARTEMRGLDADGIGTSGGNAPRNPSAPVQPIGQSGFGQLTPPNVETSPARLPKSNIAAQRARTGKLQLMDLTNYFHLPIQGASQRLSICATVLKKICRKNGLRRWPYRKLRSIERNIQSLQQSLGANGGQENARVRADIEKLQQLKAQICAGIPMDL